MAKLEGIIYKTFDHYVVLRGFAPIKDLAIISHKPDSYQRNALDDHKEEIVEFLANGEYRYFPEITLACRVLDYENFARNIGVDNAVDRDDAQFVSGLKVLSERLPFGYRARHAYLIKETNTELVRVDGNHRLEPFDDPNDSIWTKVNADINILEKLVVPYTIIFSAKEYADKFEAGIFHNINFKQKPLRQEASLKIISDLGVFDDTEKLGSEYPMALQLIEKIKSGRYYKIPWLKVTMDVENEYYRTACLRIIQLLNVRTKVIKSVIEKENERLKKAEISKKEAQKAFEEQKANYQKAKETFEKFKFDENSELRKISKKEYYEEESIFQIKRNELLEAEYAEKLSLHKVKMYETFWHNVTSIDSIINAIDVVHGGYDLFKENEYGNIAFLCAMVYYALLDKNKLKSFVNWAMQNGITKIIEPDDLSKSSSNNLVNMFEQIHQAKANEIFISMQFGDSQSELIYEKIVRAIEKFNVKHKNITLNVRPIRVDRTVESSTFSIQDKILDAIQSCSLIIADLSSANINVYHEIGYAMGVAQSHNMIPNMILLYKEDTDHNKERRDIDKFIGFNLRNLSQLRFKDYSQLVDGLVNRLEKHFGVYHN